MQSPVAAAQQTSSRVSDVTPVDLAVRRRTFAFTEFQRPMSSKTISTSRKYRGRTSSSRPYPMHGNAVIGGRGAGGRSRGVDDSQLHHEIHSFHIHQIHFRVLESDDKFLENRMLDTINVPPAIPDANWSRRSVTPGRVRVLMRFPSDISGMFVFHCTS